MRAVSVALNAIVVVFFSVFAGGTFLSRDYFDRLARDFVTDKTVTYSEPIVEIADEGLKSPAAKRFLNEDQRAAARIEIDDYRRSPMEYVSKVVSKQALEQPQRQGNPLAEKVVNVKRKVQEYYDRTFRGLLNDLRIFSITNLVAGSAALFLALRPMAAFRKSIVWFSFLMFAAVISTSYAYIDDISYFNIMMGWYMGWTYPLALITALTFLFLDYGKYLDSDDVTLQAG